MFNYALAGNEFQYRGTIFGLEQRCSSEMKAAQSPPLPILAEALESYEGGSL
jgi:hypothetical protein